MACWCDGKCPYIEAPHTMAMEGRHRQAHAALRNILVKAPYCVEANLAIAIVLTKGNHAEQAEIHIARAAEKAGETPRIRFERGAMYRTEARLDEAAQEFSEAQKLEPENPAPVASMIGALEMAGHAKEALEVASAARARWPMNIHIRRQFAIVADALGDIEGAVETLTGPNLEPIDFLDRGRFKEKIGDYPGAWADWMEGKRLLREKAGHHYDAARFENIFANLTEAANPPKPAFCTPAPELPSYPMPLFITGFPRSGTTMMETVLSSHRAIVAGDELMGVSDVVEVMPALLKVRAPYPAAMIATSLGENAGAPALLRDVYMNLAQQRIRFKAWRDNKAPSKARPHYFTDKMPLNEMHIPLIRLLFPTAPIIVMHRHPLDVMVSCMGHWLANGGFYGSSLEACASHYFAVDKLTQHYRAVLPEKMNWRGYRYEAFVADPATQLANILDYVGLPHDPACLTFHKNKRTARTLSYRQVREPLHDKSIGRWKNFRAELAPAIEILKPIIEREGFEL